MQKSISLAALTALFLICPIGQGSFENGMPLGREGNPESHLIAGEITIKRDIYFQEQLSI